MAQQCLPADADNGAAQSKVCERAQHDSEGALSSQRVEKNSRQPTLNMVGYLMMLDCSVMSVETSRMTPPCFFPNRRYVIACASP